MADGTAKPVIFISYSHKDEPKKPGPNDECWLTFGQSHLQPAVKHGIYDLWVDEDIPGGGAWRTEIARKLDECDVCVLLVSRHSLASDFIIDVEIETLRKRRENGEVEIFPIVLSHCAVKTAPWIKEINLRPPSGQPLSDFDENERHKQMAKIAEEIAEIAAEIAEKKKRGAPTDIFGRPLAHAFESDVPAAAARAAASASASFQSFNIGLSGDGRGYDTPLIVDTAHLPETAYERLVGREAELKRLDEAWANSKSNILSLIAEGGAGKSALVNEWLGRLRADNYRGAEAVLGWSFYSQGTKERATSAEEFLNWALDRLGITVAATSASAKGEAIAEAVAKRRVLLVLDGVEPLQHGLDRQQGELKDAGLRALLRRVASTPPGQTHGLIVLTSRLAVKDVARWQNDVAPVVDVEKLSDEAGAALLRDNGAWGTDKELKAAAHDFGGHPLALGLLASFLKETQTGDVRRRDHIRAFFADPENPRHGHAQRVMESYEKEWLAGQPVLAIMHMVGLFDRPASGDCLNALRAQPVIEGLTDEVVSLDDSEWQRAVTRLREVRFLLPRDPAAPDALDAHPLVREWFGERLKATNEGAWRAAHGRLFEHLRDTTKEGRTPTLEDFAPLYQAIAHGCRAGRHEEALEKIFRDRICRWRADGQIEFYASKKLGARGSDLAALSWFFDKPHATPLPRLRRRTSPGCSGWQPPHWARREDSPRRCRRCAWRCGWPRTRGRGATQPSPPPTSAKPSCSLARSPPPWRRRNSPSPMPTAAAINFRWWPGERAIPMPCTPPAGARRPTRRSPMPKNGRRTGSPTIRCSIRSVAIDIAICCWPKATTPLRATERTKLCNGRGRTVCFSRLPSTR
jgi:TIR domain